MLHTRLTTRFGLRYPILNAPMALIAGGALAGAVSRAGGMGLIGGGYAGTLGAEPDLATEFARAEGARVGIGFITWTLHQAPQVLASALAFQPACLFLSFTDPAPFAAQVAAAGVPLFCQVQTLRHVEEAVAAGASAVVVQGTEAGGHGGARGLMSLLPEAADYLAARAPDTLLLGAGGIADGRGLAAALMLGADGVVVGTRLWAAAEALTPQPMVDRALLATGDATIRTRALDALRGVEWPTEFSFRVMRNPLTDTWAAREADAFAARGSLREVWQDARARGDLDVIPPVAGEAIGLIHAREAASVLVARMGDEAARLLGRAA